MDGYVPFALARRAQSGALAQALPEIREQVVRAAASGRLAGPGPVFVGIGASYAAAAAAVWELRSRGIHALRLGAGDIPLPYPASDHPVIGISQSGRSSETIAVLESIPEEHRIVVVNVTPSPVATLSPAVISLGNLEDSYASTVGYTATVAALGMMADSWAGGSPDPGWDDLAVLVEEVDEQVSRVVAPLADLFAAASAADFVGSGPATGSAEAGALLFREVARIPATGMSTRQYLHGSMESAGDGVHIVFGDDREHDLAETLAAAGHQVILITSQPKPETQTLHPVVIPSRPAAQRAVLEAVVLQALVESVATVKGVEIEEFVFHNADTKVEPEEAS